MFHKFKFGFRKSHSTETVLLTNDILMTADSGNLLPLLDSSAAFTTTDHTAVLNRLRNWMAQVELFKSHY